MFAAWSGYLLCLVLLGTLTVATPVIGVLGLSAALASLVAMRRTGTKSAEQ